MKKYITFLLTILSIQVHSQIVCTETLLQKNGYKICYSQKLNHPIWVLWTLDSTDLGEIERQNNFRIDENLPAKFYKAKPSDYRNSGFDKGHLCNSGDRTKTQILNEETFLLSNIIPQAPNCNRITWKNLEENCREWAKSGYQLQIVAGVYGTGGVGQFGKKKRLHKINIPSNIWKVIKLTMNNQSDYLVVDIPNSQNINSNWEHYRISKQELERRSSIDFSEFFK